MLLRTLAVVAGVPLSFLSIAFFIALADYVYSRVFRCRADEEFSGFLEDYPQETEV
jgi:hypothetical protein